MCKRGQHKLVDIFCSDLPGDVGEAVVRWCEECGGIVVDRDYDGRTAPGAIYTMRFPEAVKRLVEKEQPA